MRILVTGGSGFIGSNFIKLLLRDKEVTSGIEQVANLDLLTYAGKGNNLEHMGLADEPRYDFVRGDICDPATVQGVFQEYRPDVVFHFAAESHVDRSNQDDAPFKRTNIKGTEVLCYVALKEGVKRFVHISTDEVYGSISRGSFSELSPLNPSNPYANTKVGAEGRVMDYITQGLPAIITRSANNHGPYQFPEKLLPLFMTNLIKGKKVPLMWSEQNPGLNVRDWLHVEDNCRAIWYVSQNGNNKEIYNIPGNNERTNMEMTQLLLSYFGFSQEMIEKVPHRSAHDFRYSISGDKLNDLGFEPKHSDLKHEVTKLCSWYENNESWWRPLKK